MLRLKKLKTTLSLWLFLFCSVTVNIAHAELIVDVAGQGDSQYRLSIVPFVEEQAVLGSTLLTETIRQDLSRTGFFTLLDGSPLGVVSQVSQIDPAALQSQSAQALVLGLVQGKGNVLEVQFRLAGVNPQQQLAGMRYVVQKGQARQVAHQIADLIYETLSGKRGVFSTRVGYVLQENGQYLLQVADADGANAKTLFTTKQPIISPAWSPDGQKLAYVSFEDRKPVIYIQDIYSGERRIVAGFKGNNSAPAWAPDGKSLAIALTYNGEAQLYRISANGGKPERLMHSAGIDTEPAFSPDGKSLFFTSDRGGSPQIYRLNLSNNSVQRVSFAGEYNVSPKVSPDGQSLVYVQRAGGFRVMLHDINSGVASVLSQGPNDQSPSFAPNGQFVVYASQRDGQQGLATTSIDGKVTTRLHTKNGKVKAPVWGGFARY